jgi:hypothetical protein
MAVMMTPASHIFLGDDSLTVLQLTPFMMKEWAMSIVCKSHLGVSKIID